MSHSPCKQMQILTSFKGLALCTSYFDLLVLQNVRTDYMIRMPARNLEELHFFSCFAMLLVLPQTFALFPLRIKSLPEKPKQELSHPLISIFFCLPGTQAFSGLFEKGESGCSQCAL